MNTIITTFFSKRNFFLGLLFLTSFYRIEAQDYTQEIHEINLNTLQENLSTTAAESFSTIEESRVFIQIPLPNRERVTFKVIESPIMSDKLAKAYPTIKTYAVQNTADPTETGRITVSPNGLMGVILSKDGMINIAPVDLTNPVAHKIELGINPEHLVGEICAFDEAVKGNLQPTTPTSSGSGRSNAISNGTTTRTYDFAAVATGEFTVGNGGTSTSATTVITNTVNAMQAIFEKELAVKFNLLTPHIYTDINTDPFTPGGNSRTRQAAEAVAANFNSANYDIGHVFHKHTNGDGWASGGVAALGAVCDNSTGLNGGTGPEKAAGWSGSFNNTDNGWISLATHEIAHMFGAPHTFNGIGNSNCDGGNHPSSTAYEIGSGTTIMSYNGLCQTDNNIPSGGAADNYFHTNSLELMYNYINSQNCETATASGNTPPVVNANPCGGTFAVPVGTPFTLTGSGTDVDGHTIYYTWEQYDEDGANVTPTHGFIGSTAAASAIAPLFRSYPPNTSSSRTFPSIDLVKANNYSSSFEPLPTVARTLNFRLTGRDQQTAGGGIHCANAAVTVAGSTAFSVTSQNTSPPDVTAGNAITITWEVAGTTGSPFNYANVAIKLSIDGGDTYPYTLVTTANDGSESITIPNGIPATTKARIKVECGIACFNFFDINNADFTIINTACSPSGATFSGSGDVTANAGDASLNLTLSPVYGTSLSSKTVTTTGSSPIMALTVNNGSGGCQNNFGETNPYEIIEFYAPATGNYTFTQSGVTIPHSVINLYENAFDNTASCNNWLASSTTSSITGGAPISNVNLTQNKKYIIVISASDFGSGNTGAATITFSPTVVEGGAPNPGASYSYTYVAVNASDIATKIDAGANFTSLAGGVYTVYGFSVLTTDLTNFNNLQGQNFTQLTNGTYCAQQSSNTIQLTVSGAATPCPTISTLAGTASICSADNTTSLIASGLTNMSTTYGVKFVYSTTQQTVANTIYGLSTTLGTVANGNLTSSKTVATLANVTYPTTADTYYVYAIMSPTPTDGTCRPFKEFTVTVKSIPTVTKPTDQTVTVGGMTAAVTFSGTASATYAWTNDNNNTGIPSGGNGNIIAYTTTNAGVSNITVTPTLNGCVGTAETFKVTVNAAASNNCPADVTIMTTNFNGDTTASATIKTQNMVMINGPTTFSAPTITLTPGFSVPNGQTFTAKPMGCTATAMADGTCSAPHPITCGQVFSGNTANNTNTWTDYTPGNSYTGPETVHTINVPANTTVTLTMSGLSDDLDLFTASTCSNTTELQSSVANGNSDEVIVITNNTASAQMQYVIVDGWVGATSTYTLSCATSFTSPIAVVSRNSKLDSQSLLAKEISLEVYPNPATQLVNLDYTTSKNAPVAISLYNLNGEQIKTLLPLQEKTKGQHQLKVDLSTIHAGMYFIMLQQEGHIQSKKLVITQ